MQPGFIETESGRLFYVLHPPQSDRFRGAVLFAQPFAEEQNKSRRMVALQSRLLAEQGFAVLIPDLFGCGDSEGDFAHADWNRWRSDLTRCSDWLRVRYSGVIILWGLRTGCLLISDLLASGAVSGDTCLLWQPVTDGDLYLNQFLRLRTAASMISGRQETLKDLRHALNDGHSLEVAGYSLSATLAAALSRARLRIPPRILVHWLEVAMNDTGELAPASQRVVASLRLNGVTINSAVVSGEPFWATQEIREVPALLQATVQHLMRTG